MPRYRRQKSMTGVNHIMVRGVGGMKIFHDDEDRQRYLDTLLRFKGENNFEIYAYSLMPNHVHLLVRELDEQSCSFMKRIGVSHAYQFNTKYIRVGHLYQDRYRSEAIETIASLFRCKRYLHKNASAAGLVKLPCDYPWSSYKHYLEAKNTSLLVNTDFILDQFSENRMEAIKRLKEFTEEEDDDDNFLDYDGIHSKIKINSSDWPKILELILDKHKISLESLRKEKYNRKRKVVLQEIKSATGFPVRELSRLLGISKDTISRA